MNWTARFVAGLLALLFLPACERPESPLEKSTRVSSIIRFQFENEFEDPILPFNQAPLIGRTGELASSENLTFHLLNFPEEALPKLEALMVPLVKKHEVKTLAFSYYEYDPRSVRRDVVVGTGTLTIHQDGRVEKASGRRTEEAVPGATFRGKSIFK